MDPGLRQLLAEADADSELEVILKLRTPAVVPPGARIVARFGDVVTARIARRDVQAVWGHPDVLSVKAPRLVAPGDDPSASSSEAPAPRPPVNAYAGRGVVVAVLDWGCDVAHPNFRRLDGSTRLLGLWHQGLSHPGDVAQPYGYGRIFDRASIDAALRTKHPYDALGFHPAQSDPHREGTHGAHVLDIAAGNGAAPNSQVGAAPEADLIFVHLATEALEPLANLGDTVRILEGLDFVRRCAGVRPWVANLSLGRHGGPHDGRTLVEQGIDNLLIEAPGRAIVQSCGNYYDASAHATGRLRPGRSRTLKWLISPADRTPNEIEIWYSGRDTFAVRLEAPGGQGAWDIALGADAPLIVAGQTVGHAYHRAFDPAAGDHHVDVFVSRAAPSGVWLITLSGADVVDGRYHAWVERDAACENCQSVIESRDVVRTSTTGTICNSLRGIAVGAYDARSAARSLGRFSSSGPTRDGRMKPDLLAPGVAISAARSASASGGGAFTTVKSGTSMAAPRVAGVIACMFEAAGRPLPIQTTRELLLGTADVCDATPSDRHRVGSGYLNAERAIAAAAALRTHILESAENTESAMNADHQCECRTTVESADHPSSSEVEADGQLQAESSDEPEADDELEVVESLESIDSFVEDASVDEDDEAYEPALQPSDVALDDGSADRAEALFEQLEQLAHELPRDGSFDQSFESRGVQPAIALDAPFARLAFANPARFDLAIVGAPGEPLRAALRRGDLLLRSAYGEPAHAHAALIADPTLVAPYGVSGLARRFERAGPGGYATVVELGVRPHCRHDRYARRIVDRRGRLPFGQMILRTTELLERADPTFDEVSTERSWSEAGARTQIKVRNRLVRHDTIGSCAVSLGSSASGTTSAHGVVALDLSALADGVYSLNVVPPNTLGWPALVGPGVGSAALTPTRIWRPFTAEVAVRGGRIVSSTSPDVEIDGVNVIAKVQPVWMRSPNQSDRRGVAVSHIVIHHTAGPVIGPALNTFLSQSEQRSAHYVIDVDGQIVKMVHEDRQSWHAGTSYWAGRDGVGKFSIGIEIVHRSGPYPEAQYTALLELLTALRGAHPTIAAANIVGHSDIATNVASGPTKRLGRKSGDPGATFEWERLEAAGHGVVRPAMTPATLGFGGFFTLHPTGRLREGDRDDQKRYGGRVESSLPGTVILELQQRLACIGYFCSTNGRFDLATRWALQMFQEHFCSGTRPRPTHAGELDLATAQALQAVTAELPCATQSSEAETEAWAPEDAAEAPNPQPKTSPPAQRLIERRIPLEFFKRKFNEFVNLRRDPLIKMRIDNNVVKLTLAKDLVLMHPSLKKFEKDIKLPHLEAKILPVAPRPNITIRDLNSQKIAVDAAIVNVGGGSKAHTFALTLTVEFETKGTELALNNFGDIDLQRFNIHVQFMLVRDVAAGRGVMAYVPSVKVDVQATMNYGPDAAARDRVRGQVEAVLLKALRDAQHRDAISKALTRWLVGGEWDVRSVAVDKKDLVIGYIEPPRDQVVTPFPEQPQKPLNVGKLSKIDHIVVLMMENRSFDHMLGYLRLGGRRDVDGLTGKETNEYKGTNYPVFHLKGTVFDADPCHNHHCVLTQIGANNMGGFVADFAAHIPAAKQNKMKPGDIMGYYDGKDLPVYDTLAREFVICDRWFCSHPGGTFPNRFYAVSGRLDRDQFGRNVAVNPDMVTFAPTQTKTIFDHLADRKISWRYYEHGYGFLRLFHRWGADVEHVRPATDFYKDVAAGKLPAVSYIDPDFIEFPPANDDHAPADVRDGQRLIGRLVDALMKGPAWSRTLFVITYDEHGGFYDHVVPPAAVNVSGVNEYGVRVPAIVVSPWVERGAVSHIVFDHTSILKTIIRRFCAANPPDLGARVTAAKDLEPLLSRARARTDKPAIHIPKPSGSPLGVQERFAELSRSDRDMDLESSRDFHALLAVTRARYGAPSSKGG